MRRRELLGCLGSAAAGWPLAAHAQKIRTIGILMNGAAGETVPQSNVTAFVDGTYGAKADQPRLWRWTASLTLFSVVMEVRPRSAAPAPVRRPSGWTQAGSRTRCMRWAVPEAGSKWVALGGLQRSKDRELTFYGMCPLRERWPNVPVLRPWRKHADLNARSRSKGTRIDLAPSAPSRANRNGTTIAIGYFTAVRMR
jgi:hypothetical protein